MNHWQPARTKPFPWIWITAGVIVVFVVTLGAIWDSITCGMSGVLNARHTGDYGE